MGRVRLLFLHARILHANEHITDVTVSPRTATGNSEPSHYDAASLTILDGTTITDEMFVVKAVCHNCRVWPHGSLNTKSTAQPMIYAFGPGSRIQSDALDAPLHRHYTFGHFTMDLVAATGNGSVPAPNAGLRGVVIDGDMTRDHDRANLAHAIMGCLAIFLFWPINVIAAGFFKRIKIHIVISIMTMVFLVISYALGISMSGEYNRVSFPSPSKDRVSRLISYDKIERAILTDPYSRNPTPQLTRSSPSSLFYQSS